MNLQEHLKYAQTSLAFGGLICFAVGTIFMSAQINDLHMDTWLFNKMIDSSNDGINMRSAIVDSVVPETEAKLHLASRRLSRNLLRRHMLLEAALANYEYCAMRIDSALQLHKEGPDRMVELEKLRADMSSVSDQSYKLFKKYQDNNDEVDNLFEDPDFKDLDIAVKEITSAVNRHINAGRMLIEEHWGESYIVGEMSKYEERLSVAKIHKKQLSALAMQFTGFLMLTLKDVVALWSPKNEKDS